MLRKSSHFSSTGINRTTGNGNILFQQRIPLTNSFLLFNSPFLHSVKGPLSKISPSNFTLISAVSLPYQFIGWCSPTLGVYWNHHYALTLWVAILSSLHSRACLWKVCIRVLLTQKLKVSLFTLMRQVCFWKILKPFITA